MTASPRRLLRSGRHRHALGLGLGLAALLAARSAEAAVPDVWAFAYNDTLAPPPGAVMNPAYQAGSFQAVCPGAMATITQTAVGRYVVTFPCSASSNGVVHVTAVDDNARYCGIESWADAGAHKNVVVRCFKGPAPDNAKFTVSYTRSSGAPADGAHAYVYGHSTGALLASYNSTGAANTIVHTATGRWTVTLGALDTGSYDGDLQATAVTVQGAARRCKIDNWFRTSPDYGVFVVCTDSNGVLSDTSFTLSYHFRRSVVGTQPDAFAYMTNLAGAPPGSDFNSIAPPNSFSAAPPGRYTMKYPAVGLAATHMHVTALGGALGHYCQLERLWVIGGADVDAPVICFNNVGVRTDHLLFSTFASSF